MVLFLSARKIRKNGDGDTWQDCGDVSQKRTLLSCEIPNRIMIMAYLGLAKYRNLIQFCAKLVQLLFYYRGYLHFSCLLSRRLLVLKQNFPSYSDLRLGTPPLMMDIIDSLPRMFSTGIYPKIRKVCIRCYSINFRMVQDLSNPWMNSNGSVDIMKNYLEFWSFNEYEEHDIQSEFIAIYLHCLF